MLSIASLKELPKSRSPSASGTNRCIRCSVAVSFQASFREYSCVADHSGEPQDLDRSTSPLYSATSDGANGSHFVWDQLDPLAQSVLEVS